MFHWETLARTIHADRVRDLERAATERRLLARDHDAAEPAGPVVTRSTLTRPATAASTAGGSTRTAPRDGSAGIPA
ncbi:MAG: hypothetical protein M3Q66_01575 [Chloroflexota bacterium]|nr:hypothetical protein [Chloroflexota bacterium]